MSFICCQSTYWTRLQSADDMQFRSCRIARIRIRFARISLSQLKCLFAIRIILYALDEEEGSDRRNSRKKNEMKRERIKWGYREGTLTAASPSTLFNVKWNAALQISRLIQRKGQLCNTIYVENDKKTRLKFRSIDRANFKGMRTSYISVYFYDWL